MVRTISIAIASLFAIATLHAETFKFFGSAGAEWQLAPANSASALNPRNVAQLPYSTSSGDAVAFFDAAPESRAWKLHLKLRGDAAEGGNQQVDLGEASLQINPRPWLDITIGRVIEKWGTGYAWNPTAFVSPKKNPADPSDRRSANRGLNMIRTDLFVRGTNVSFYALEHGAVAARAYRLIGGTDVSIHFRRDGDGTQQGISAARVFGDALELHGEIARRHALAGGQYTFRNSVNVVAELYHGGDGLDANAYRAFRIEADSAHDEKTFRAANAAYAPLRMARNYAFVRLAWSHDKLDAEVIAITNLRDGSLLARVTLTRKLRANVSVYLIDTEFAGARASELSYMQVRRVTTTGARFYFENAMNVNEQKMKWVGVLTWIIIGIPSVLWEAEFRSLFAPRAAMLFGAFIIFLIGFLAGTRPGCGTPAKIVTLLVETLAAYACVALQPTGFQPVLLVILAAQLGAFPPRFAVVAIAVNSIFLGLIMANNGGSPVIYAMVYFAFSLFALFSMHVAHSEMEARKALAEANAELRMTTELLEISSRTSERLRIARDLHDLLGHHLTALSLNLEVAGHMASGDAKEHIEKSKSIAKHLLADVRDVVSRLRNDEPVDLTSSLESLRDVIVAPSLHLDFPRELAVADANIAEVALRTVQEIVTNAVRHSGARNLWLNLGTSEQTLSIDARDDGMGSDNVRFGNGLLGLRERVQQARGTFEVSSMRGRGFTVHVTLPLGATA